MSTVILVRGLPGSGKTTWIDRNFGVEEPVICSADHYFMVNGEYRYDHEKIEEAHAACFEHFHTALSENRDLVIVDNVLHRLWNISPYMSVAKLFNYECKLVQIYCKDPWDAWKRNQHQVPEKQFGWLLQGFEKSPRSWNEKKFRSEQSYW